MLVVDQADHPPVERQVVYKPFEVTIQSDVLRPETYKGESEHLERISSNHLRLTINHKEHTNPSLDVVSPAFFVVSVHYLSHFPQIVFFHQLVDFFTQLLIFVSVRLPFNFLKPIYFFPFSLSQQSV